MQMTNSDTIKDFCFRTYQNVYSSTHDALVAEMESDAHGKPLNSTKIAEIETVSQKKTIKFSIVEGMKTFPSDIPAVWHSIYEAHVYRKSGVADFSVIQNVVSADQSWKKSSGHAFEEMVKEMATLAMSGTNIEFILQRDLNALVKAGEISNEPRDISWLKEQIKGNIFDLYAIVAVEGRKYCFGCVQCKTSIRDRVTRDREPSIHAMDSYFWSVVFVLDSSYLRNPKFQHMVNGGSQEFPSNGWHAMYDISAQFNVGRIYPLNMDFQLLREHSEKAAGDWLKQRQWFNSDWKAE